MRIEVSDSKNDGNKTIEVYNGVLTDVVRVQGVLWTENVAVAGTGLFKLVVDNANSIPVCVVGLGQAGAMTSKNFDIELHYTTKQIHYFLEAKTNFTINVDCIIHHI